MNDRERGGPIGSELGESPKSLYEIDDSDLEAHDRFALRPTPYLSGLLEEYAELSKLNTDADLVRSQRERTNSVGTAALVSLVGGTLFIATIAAALTWGGVISTQYLGLTVVSLAVVLVGGLLGVAFAMLRVQRRVGMDVLHLRHRFDLYQASHIHRVLQEERREIEKRPRDRRSQ